MQMPRLIILAIAPFAPLASLAAWAQPVIGPYVSLGAGADFLQNENFKPAGNTIPLPRSYRFDVGPAGFASVGFGLGNGLRLEAEGDYSYNHVRGVTYTAPLRAGGHEQQYGGFVNAIEDLNLGLPVTPYLGVGAGYQEIELDGVNSGPAGVVGFTPHDERQGAFAYQGIAGISYAVPFVRGLALTAEYRFIGVDTPPAFRRETSPAEFQELGALHATVHNIFNHEAMIGVRYAFGAPPPPPPPPMAAPSEVPAPAAARTYLVFFDWDRAELTGRAREIISQAASASTHVQSTKIEVSGYTDLSGTATYNQALSVRRADAVAAELVRDGVARADIAVQGFGESHPLVPTAQGVREPQNRRVEIVLS